MANKLNKQELLQRISNLQNALDALEDVIIVDETPPKQKQPQFVSNSVVGVEAMDRWLSPAELAKELGISHSTIFIWVKEGRLPQGVKFSPRVRRWRLRDVLSWTQLHQEIF